jgi:hypothetical protein
MACRTPLELIDARPVVACANDIYKQNLKDYNFIHDNYS